MRKFLLISIIFFAFNCKNSSEQKTIVKKGSFIQIPNIVVLNTDSSMQLVNGIYYYKQQLFSGTIQSFYANNKLQSTQTFYKGKEEGWLQTFFETGNKESLRYFHNGEKDSVHTAWWPNGNKRLEHRFTNGNYNGVNTEWFFDGKISKQIIYNNGIDSIGKGWRNNGKLFMSYIRMNGRRYGLLNAQPCYTLKNEKGEFVETRN